MVTRYIDAQTVGQEHGKGGEGLRVWHSEIYQPASPACCETITQGMWRVEVDSHLREGAVMVGDIPDATADLTLYVYRNQQRLQLSSAISLHNTGVDACDPTPRVPFVFDIHGQFGAGACNETTPQMLSFLLLEPTLIRVEFSTGVWNAACEPVCCGALLVGDFTYVDTSVGGVTICAVSHNGGDNFAVITLTGDGVSTRVGADYDLVGLADTLSPNGCQIFGPMPATCVCGVAMPANTQPISGDTQRAVFPFGPDVLMKGDMVYAETVRDTCSTLTAAWSVEVGWMPYIFGHGSDYKTYIG